MSINKVFLFSLVLIVFSVAISAFYLGFMATVIASLIFVVAGATFFAFKKALFSCIVVSLFVIASYLYHNGSFIDLSISLAGLLGVAAVAGRRIGPLGSIKKNSFSNSFTPENDDVFQACPDMIIIMDADRRIVKANRAFLDAFKTTSEEVVGKIGYEVIHKTNAPYPQCNFQHCLANRETCFHEIYEPVLKGYYDCCLQPLIGAGGEVAGVIHIMRDATERKLVESQNQELGNIAEAYSQFESMGEMATSVTSQINSPLTGVVGLSQKILQETLPPDTRHGLERIVEGCNQIAEKVNRLSSFDYKLDLEKSSVNIHEIIDRVLSLKSQSLKASNITVKREYDPGLTAVQADPGLLQRVFFKLVAHAEHSIKVANNYGDLIITTRKEPGRLSISFKDDGQGIPGEKLPKAFSPFLLSREVGDATGFGLSVSRCIILNHGGGIEIASQPGKGQIIRLWLPVEETALKSVSKPDDPLLSSGSNKLKGVLIVDDDPVVQSFIKMAVSGLSSNVFGATSSAEALDLLTRHTFDVILMDIRMPGMSGDEIFHHIIQRWPQMKGRIIFITGDTSSAGVIGFLEKNQLPYLAKPFDEESLLAKINAMLGHHQAPKI